MGESYVDAQWLEKLNSIYFKWYNALKEASSMSTYKHHKITERAWNKTWDLMNFNELIYSMLQLKLM